MTRTAAVLGAMVAQYAAELRTSWLRGLSPHQVRILKNSLAGAREALALLEHGPGRWPRTRRRSVFDGAPVQWELAQ